MKCGQLERRKRGRNHACCFIFFHINSAPRKLFPIFMELLNLLFFVVVVFCFLTVPPSLQDLSSPTGD